MHSVKPQPPIRALTVIVLALALSSVPGCDAIERHPLVPSDRYDPVRGAAVATAIAVAEVAAEVSALRADAPLPSCRRRLPEGAATIQTQIRVTIKRRDASVGVWELGQTWRRDIDGSHAVTREITATRPDGRPASRAWEARQIGERTWASIDQRFAETSREPTMPRRITDLAFADVDALLTQIIIRGGRAEIANEWGICGRVQRDPTWPPLHRVGLALGERERIAWLHYENRQGRLIVQIDERWRPVASPVQAPEHVAEIDEDLTYLTLSQWLDVGVAGGWLETQQSVDAAAALAAAQASTEGSGEGAAQDGSGQGAAPDGSGQDVTQDGSGQGVAQEGSAQGP